MVTKKQSEKKVEKDPSPDKKKVAESTIKSNITKVVELETAQRENRSAGEKISEWIAAFCGSMTFVWVHVIWFGGWILVNSIIPVYQFDPFPYTFLTLVVSLEAIFLSTFILISQNHETQLTERRNHLDLQINMLAEQESTETLKLLQAVAKKVGVEINVETEALLEPMEPEELVKHIVAATGEDTDKVTHKK